MPKPEGLTGIRPKHARFQRSAIHIPLDQRIRHVVVRGDKGACLTLPSGRSDKIVAVRRTWL